MTAARKTQAVLKNEARAALATRLDLLLRHAITINQFDLDVAQECKRDRPLGTQRILIQRIEYAHE